MKVITSPFLCFLLFVGSFTGCRNDTTVVKKLKTAGISDPAGTPGDALVKWFGQHDQVSADVSRDCQALAPDAFVNDKTTQRICSAASIANTFKPKSFEGTGKKY